MISQWRRTQVYIYPLLLTACLHLYWLPHKVIALLLCWCLTQTDEGKLWCQRFYSLCGNKYIQFCFPTGSPITISLCNHSDYHLFSPVVVLSHFFPPPFRWIRKIQFPEVIEFIIILITQSYGSHIATAMSPILKFKGNRQMGGRCRRAAERALTRDVTQVRWLSGVTRHEESKKYETAKHNES